MSFPGGTEFKRPNRDTHFDAAHSEGWSAGGRVPLSHGLSTPTPRQIPLFDGAD